MEKAVECITQHFERRNIEVTKEYVDNGNYYKDLKFKIYWIIDGQYFEIGDGGMVDWTQQLLQNRKERLLISGIGIEYLYRIIGE